MTDALQDHEGTVSIEGRTITNLSFAEDINGLAGEEEELAKIVERLDKASTAYGMEISLEETKLMVNNTSGINTEIKANGQKLETVTSFKYLGSVTTDFEAEVLFLTETWQGMRGDEAKCTDLTPPGYCMKSFPRSSRGGGLAVIFKDYLSSRICFTTSFPFDHSSFELAQVSLTLLQHNTHLFCLYHPPPSSKNKITDSLFLDQFSDLLDRCNFLRGSLIILGDFNVHYDCPQNSTTARAMDLPFHFNLTQSVSQATHEKGHILDWLVHRSDDSIVRSTSVTSAIASDHLCVISHLHVTVPRPPPSFVMARNIRAIDRTALKDDLQGCLSGL